MYPQTKRTFSVSTNASNGKVGRKDALTLSALGRPTQVGKGRAVLAVGVRGDC